MPNIIPYRISAIKKATGAVKIFSLKPAGAAGIAAFLPGQFIFLHFLDKSNNSIIKRPYSISSAPEDDHLEFAINMKGGQFTSKLDLAKEGDILGVEEPGGHMAYRNEKKVAMICGGTGLAPMMSILRHVVSKNIQGEFILFYSVKTQADILYKEELAELEKKHPGIKIVITITRETPEDWKGECGRINEEMIKRHISIPEFTFFMCGPMAMMTSLKTCILENKADPKKIKMEGWG